MNILDQYIDLMPSIQNALNIFRGEWASKLPGDSSIPEAGVTPLFEDARIIWAIEQLGGVRDKNILELGPLEAGHSYMVEKAGAASVTAIESNTRAYLKCLIIKEILELKRVKFLCGNFIEYLRSNPGKFDICFASGVLYHMKNPAELISLISEVSEQVYIWTHYYDSNIVQNNLRFSHKFPSSSSSEYKGFEHTLYRYEYQDALNFSGFCGGNSSFSEWMSRDEIFECLKFFGFSNIQVQHDEPLNQNGPCISLVADQ
jgi:Protein of unknown function (DUF1698)